jgi:hypothetical protein
MRTAAENSTSAVEIEKAQLTARVLSFGSTLLRVFPAMRLSTTPLDTLRNGSLQI